MPRKKSSSSSGKTTKTSSKTVKRTTKAVTKAVKRSPALTVLAIIIVIVVIALAVYGYMHGWFDAFLNPTNQPTDISSEYYDVNSISSAELSIHFLELGNKYTGDSIFIKAGDTDILIDAGSRKNSAATLSNYIDLYCTDGTLEYVIATHADQDHIAGFVGSSGQGIFDKYQCNNIIDFNLSNKELKNDSGNKTLYSQYLDKRNELVAQGTNHYSALDCYNNANGASRVYQLCDTVEMEILYNYFYEHKSSDENNYSVCLLIRQFVDGYNFDNRNDPNNAEYTKNYLFTGDLEIEGEQYLVEYNTLPQVELFKAGHHGSKTSSNDCLLEVIKPKVVCVCCCAGSDEYTSNTQNQFPTQAMIDRVAAYTDAVYVTSIANDTEKGFQSFNGNIVYTCSGGKVTMYFSESDVKLKDSDWFKNNRTCPMSWQ